jgi:hypothetical protein
MIEPRRPTMNGDLGPGDYLIFQLESGYGLLRVLGVEETPSDTIWHLKAYGDLFLDPDTADAALENTAGLTTVRPHVALTNRAFESTQVAKMRNSPVTEVEADEVREWKADPDREVNDRSIRLLLGLR